MNNKKIIAQIAINQGIYSEEELEDMLSNGQEIPLHTYKGWKDRGMTVRKGERGLECKLWKKKTAKRNDKNKETSEDEEFYLTKSYLFTKEQVEKNSGSVISRILDTGPQRI